MKKSIKPILAFLLAAMLTVTALSCAKKETPSADTGNSAPAKTDATADPNGQANPNGQADTPAETEWPLPDYSDFVMPEDTGKLYLYVDGAMGRAVMNPAVERFRELYPDVEVTYEVLSDDEFSTRSETELPAGAGPDLFFFKSVPDIYKTMGTGLFTDLNPYFDADPEIDPGEFVAGVMRGGMYQGRRYIVPICFKSPILVARRSVLDELGIDDPSDFGNLAEAARRYHEAYPDSSLFLDYSAMNTWMVNLPDLIQYAGLRFIDYERGVLDCDEERVREIMDLVKLYYDPDYVEYDESRADRLISTYMDYGCLVENECLFNYFDDGYQSFSMVKKTLAEMGDEAVAFVPRGWNGETTADIVQMAAIPQGAKNKLNAWRLMKVLLSDEIQAGRDDSRFGNSYFWAGMPVRLSSLRTTFEYDVEYWGFDLKNPAEQKILDEFMTLWSSSTTARKLPSIVNRYIILELMPYVRGEKAWDDCWKRFVSTLELYASE